MKIVELLVKPRPGAPMTAVASVEGVAGVGLSGDCHGSGASPRQVLVCSRVVLDELGLAASALRANVVVDEPVDDLASGTMLRLGETFSLRITMSCEACRKLDVHRPGLARALVGRRGMLARVVRGGLARVGERVAMASAAYPPLDASWRARVADIVQHVPKGMLLTYPKLAELAGVQSSYCRAFPRVLERLRADHVLTATAAAKRTEPQWDGRGYWAGG